MLNAADVKRELKRLWPMYKYRVTTKHVKRNGRSGVAWTWTVLTTDAQKEQYQKDKEAIKHRVDYILDHPEEFASFQPISATCTGVTRMGQA